MSWTQCLQIFCQQFFEVPGDDIDNVAPCPNCGQQCVLFDSEGPPVPPDPESLLFVELAAKPRRVKKPVAL